MTSSDTSGVALEIHTWINGLAPPSYRWNAMLGEYDLGVRIFTGATQREAINELLDYFEQDNGEIKP